MMKRFVTSDAHYRWVMLALAVASLVVGILQII